MSKFISNLLSKPFIKHLLKFAIVGAIGTIVNLSILYFLTEFANVYYIISEIIAFMLSALNNYILNKIWTFKEKIQEQIIKKYFQFTLVCLVSLLFNISILFILVEYFNLWYILAELIAIICSFLINFLGSKLWTFKSKVMK